MEKIAIIGVPLDLGGNRRGVDMGPSAMRVAGLVDQLSALGFDVKDTGDIDVPLPEECDPGDPKAKYAEDIAEVCKDLAERTLSVMKEGYRPVVLGGDHSVAMGSISGISRFYREQEKGLGLIWFDAHGDMNTPATSSSGNVHGMPLAYLLGIGNGDLAAVGGGEQVRPTNTVLIGIRDLDDREKKLIADSGVRVFTMKDIDRHGISHVMEIAIEIASRGGMGFHVSFDVDVMDPSVARGVGTPSRGGLTYRESHLSLEIIADSKLLTSLDVVEVNPILDVMNGTAEVGVELILSALGKRIY